MDTGFEAHTMVGLCYKREGRIFIQGSKQEWDLEEVLSGLKGREVQYLVQYLPEGEPDPSKWGLGCCQWQPSTACPAGHHERPQYMLNLNGEGRLLVSQRGEYVALSKGKVTPLGLTLLEGHRCRLAFVTKFDAEAEMEKVSIGGLSSVEDMLEIALKAQAELAKIKKMMGETE